MIDKQVARGSTISIASSMVVNSIIVPILIGVFSSFVATVVFLVCLRSLRPKIVVSDKIARAKDPDTGKDVWIVKVVNIGRRPFADVKVRLVMVHTHAGYGGPVLTIEDLKLRRDTLFQMPRYDKHDADAKYAVQFRIDEDIDSKWVDDMHYHLRFIVSGVDGVSGFRGVFPKDYRLKEASLKVGEFEFGKSIRIKTPGAA